MKAVDIILCLLLGINSALILIQNLDNARLADRLTSTRERMAETRSTCETTSYFIRKLNEEE